MSSKQRMNVFKENFSVAALHALFEIPTLLFNR